jgi:hypothetical protein
LAILQCPAIDQDTEPSLDRLDEICRQLDETVPELDESYSPPHQSRRKLCDVWPEPGLTVKSWKSIHLGRACLFLQNDYKAQVSVIRWILDAQTHGQTTPIPYEDGYIVVSQTGERSRRDLWLDGKSIVTEPSKEGMVALHDLRRSPVFKIYTPINSLNFLHCVPRARHLLGRRQCPRNRGTPPPWAPWGRHQHQNP